MGRIGQSLIMLGQPPYCSLFGVCWADDGLRLLVRVLVCVCISMWCVRWDKAMAGKKDPTLSHPPTPPPPPRLTSMPLQIGFYITEAVRYEHLIFLSSFWLFLSFIPLPYPPPPFLFWLSCSILPKYFSFFVSWFSLLFFPYPPFFSLLPARWTLASPFSPSLKVTGRFLTTAEWSLPSGRVVWPTSLCDWILLRVPWKYFSEIGKITWKSPIWPL